MVIGRVQPAMIVKKARLVGSQWSRWLMTSTHTLKAIGCNSKLPFAKSKIDTDIVSHKLDMMTNLMISTL